MGYVRRPERHLSDFGTRWLAQRLLLFSSHDVGCRNLGLCAVPFERKLGMTPGYWKTALLGAALAASFSGAASAGPIRNFLVSEGTQPSNVGAIKLTQVDAN